MQSIYLPNKFQGDNKWLKSYQDEISLGMELKSENVLKTTSTPNPQYRIAVAVLVLLP